QKETPFQRNTEQNEAQQSLIKALTEAPVLKNPDYSKPFTVTTDASDIACGAVLSQDDHPIAYLSRKFTQQELNRPAYEKELAAVNWALHKWEHYLIGNHFTLRTDNAAITALKTQAKLTAKQSRWIQYLEEFDMEIQHIPGK